MRRVLTICLFALAAVLVAAPAALAASGPAPTITRVQPMRVSVGNLLTITGSHFKAQRTRTPSSSAAPTAVRPSRSRAARRRRKLVVRVPAAVARLLRVSGSRQRPTRLKLRVLSGQFSKFTTRRLSPVVTGVGDGDGGPGGGGGGGGGTVVCNDSADHDGDLLPNTLELAIGTDPCLADTDNDQMTDGWEYWSAKDLNIKAVPYPGKRPFPNALDPSDGAPARRGTATSTSTATASPRSRSTAPGATPAARSTPRRPAASISSRRSGYSDGTQYSRASETPGVPAWRGPSYGLAGSGRAVPGDAQPARRRRVARRRARRRWRRHGELHRVGPRPGSAELVGGFYAKDAHKAEPWGPSPRRPAARSSATSTSGRSRSWTWPTPTSTATRSSTARTIRTTTTVSNIREMYEVVGTDLDGDGGFTAVRRRTRASTSIRRGVDPARQRRSTRAPRIRTRVPALSGSPSSRSFPRSSSSNLAPAPSFVGCGRHVFPVRDGRGVPRPGAHGDRRGAARGPRAAP